jgi:glycerol-3-phosphate O-acyltransferase
VATTESTPRTGGPQAVRASVVVLVDARSRTERTLIAEWARSAHPGAELLDHDGALLARRLAREDDPLIVPARVTWLPSARHGDGGTQSVLGDLRALSARQPPPLLQPVVLRRARGRARVTAGEPARAHALHAEFEEETGGTDGALGFAAFVGRRATLAVDRAERPLIGDRYKVPRLVAEQVAASARVRENAAALAAKLERDPDDLLAELTADLQELAAVQSPPAIDAFRAVMGPMHRRAWTVDADMESLERLRELNRRTALVFLPSHRSYSDPLVLADVLDSADFPRNHLLGGKNLSFWPIGPLGKRAGLIFIRRSFGDDQVYKLAVREYFGHLVAKRFNLEWYIEGGRTRTGKLRPPRYGLLHYLVRALTDGRAEDVTLVPVSITYEQLQEVAAMAAEQGGGAKSAEGLAWLAGYLRAQRRNVGTVRVRFGVPLSLAQALADAGEGSAQLEKVAFRICVGINRVSPVTASSLVTFALLSVRDRALTLEQVRAVIAPLLEHLDARAIPGPAADLRDASAVNDTLAALVAGGVVTVYADGAEPVWSIAPDHHHVAAFYRNGMLHHVLNRAIIELVVQGLATQPPDGDPAEAAWQQALALRDLLKFEFFFARKTRFSEQIADEAQRLGWDGSSAPGEAAKLIAGAPVLVAHSVLRSFIDAQFVVACRLASRGAAALEDEQRFVHECLTHGRQLLLQGRIHGADSVSRELFTTALKLAANRGLIAGDAEGRRAWLAELVGIRGLLDRIAQIDAVRLEEVLDGDAG